MLATLVDSYLMTTLGHHWINVSIMLAIGCHSNHGATSAQIPMNSGQIFAAIGPALSQCWQHVGNRLLCQSWRDSEPSYANQLLLNDDFRGNVGSISATGCHTNHGMTSAQAMLADSYLKTVLGYRRVNVGLTLAYVGNWLSYDNHGATLTQTRAAHTVQLDTLQMHTVQLHTVQLHIVQLDTVYLHIVQLHT
ncbi:hypothetical protein G5I_00434 [Acromyrmex echinatior]|uniref:Uncharacterized protein n=1 Tax=Acromyrmex echinatior TaxID=103372 RepID=F4W4V6_ACREC|nr:hypothetical protein G5I_00434 [Acromyrmex echinatior]